jgi:uncharacterized protein (DUF433 family)
MAKRSLDSHIAETPGICGGKPRIAGRRIKVQYIAIWHVRMGMSIKKIAREYDLELADIHAAIAFYYDNRDEIDRQIAEDEAFVEEMRKKNPSLLSEKLKTMMGDPGTNEFACDKTGYSS